MVFFLAIVTVLLPGCDRDKRTPDEGAAPERIVSLTPSSTEVVIALGAGDRLVGVDTYSELPSELGDLPRAGTFLEPNLEAVLALKPDLVILDRVQSKVADPLASAGIRTLALKMHTIEDVRRGLARVGEAIGRSERAETLRDEIDETLAAARGRAKERAEGEEDRPVVLAVIERDPGQLRRMVVAGPGSYVDELLAVIGAENAMAASGLRYSNIGAEQILRAKPTVILDAAHAKDGARVAGDWERLASVPAVAQGKVVPIADRMFTSPSVRVAEALRRLEQMIYGIRSE